MTVQTLPFESAYRHGFARVAACTIPVAIADPATNAEAVLAAARECDADAVAVAVFPELCLTGYSLEDLVLQDPVLDAVEAAIERLVEASVELLPMLVVGAPLRHRNRIYNCAVVIHRGEVLGVAPKSYLPTYREFYERRWYAPGDDQSGEYLVIAGVEAPFGPDLLFEALDVPGLVVHVEMCEDYWVPDPAVLRGRLAGATVLANLSGSPITIARADDRKLLSPVPIVPMPRGVCICRGGNGRVDERRVVGRPDHDLRSGPAARRDRALPRRSAAVRRRRRSRPPAPGRLPPGHVR